MKQTHFFSVLISILFLSSTTNANLPLEFLWKPTKLVSKLAAEKKQDPLCQRKVLVAVIDTGIDVRHPDLRSAIWMNEGESGLDSQGRDKATNGVDDDGNGYVDDVHGWNFANNSADVSDSHGHGTHIAGIIAGYGQNETEQYSSCVKIMAIKYVDPNTGTMNSIRNTTLSILYAIRMGAEIINYSGGGLNSNELEKRSVMLADHNQVLFIAASGNEASNADVRPFFPASYKTPNMISVGAVDRDGNLLENSNYGEKSVDLAAPGLSIFSTLPDQKYGFMSGTSQATAFVTRAAAMLMSQRPLHDAKPSQWKGAVIALAKTSPRLKGKFRHAGVITAELSHNEPQIRRLGQSRLSRNF